MLRILSIAILISFWTSNVIAQNGNNIYENMLIPEEYKQQEAEQEQHEAERNRIQSQAGKLLDSKPNVLKIDNPNLKVSTSAQVQTSEDILSEAPFGLAWGSSIRSVKALGVNLRALDSTSHPNSYEATLLPKPVKDFSNVVLSFGDNNKLWRIVAYTEPSYDDENASKGLSLYRKYSAMLALKYGNKKEVFTPKISHTQVAEVDDKGRPATKIVESENSVGDKSFLQDLSSEETSLYSIFDDEKIGTSLTLFVDEETKSYIIIEYKNSEIIKEQYLKTLNSL